MNDQIMSTPIEVIRTETDYPDASFDTCASGACEVQVVTKDRALAEKLADQMHHLNLAFDTIAGFSVGFVSKHITDIIPIVLQSQKKQSVIIYVGEDQSSTKAVFDAFQLAEEPFSMTLIQSCAARKNSLDTCLMDLREPWLLGMYLLATQASHTDTKALAAFEHRGLKATRLATLRAELGACEPDIRESDVCSVSLNALRFSDAPFQSGTSPVGLTAEELCQLSYYAGRSDRNRVLSIHDLKLRKKDLSLAASLLAEVIWYYMWGLNHRRRVGSKAISSMKQYLIEGQVNGDNLVFLKDEGEQKWWLKQPMDHPYVSKKFPVIACDYHDYEYTAQHHALSDRLTERMSVLGALALRQPS